MADTIVLFLEVNFIKILYYIKVFLYFSAESDGTEYKRKLQEGT